MAAKLEEIHFYNFVALYLFVALHRTPAQSVYTSVFLSPKEQNSVTMEEGRNLLQKEEWNTVHCRRQVAL